MSLIYPRPTNVSSTPGFFFDYPSTLLGGSLWGQLILLGVFSISYMALSSFESQRAFAASSFISLVTCIMMIGLPPSPIVGSFELAITGSMVLVSLIINNGQGGTR